MSCLTPAMGTCPLGTFRCQTVTPETCIDRALVSDTRMDCSDNSDEGKKYQLRLILCRYIQLAMYILVADKFHVISLT